MKKQLLILTLLVIISSLSFISSAYKQGDLIDLKISTNETSCDVTITYPNSTNIVHEVAMQINSGYANYTFNNSLSTGEYQYFSDCGSGSFMVTPNGEEATTGKAVFYIGLLFVLLFFFAVTIFFFSDTDNILGKVASIGLGYLLLIAITFIAWNMAKDFLTSSPFLIEMMRIVFFVLIVGLFPLVLGGFIWYFLMLFKIKEIQRLMDRGIGYDEAKKRAGSGGKYK
jgi:hypothetical protein